MNAHHFVTDFESSSSNLVCGKCGEPLVFVEGKEGPSWESTYELYECECGMTWRMYLIADLPSRKNMFDVLSTCKDSDFE